MQRYWLDCHLVEFPLGVSKEGDGISLPHAHSHSSEPGRRAVQNGVH